MSLLPDAQGRRKRGGDGACMMREEGYPTTAEVEVGLDEVSGTCARCYLLKVGKEGQGQAGGREGDRITMTIARGDGRGAQRRRLSVVKKPLFFQ